MLELIINEGEKGIKQPSIPIRWCLDKETLEKIKDKNDPHILVVITNCGGIEIKRRLFSLNNAMGFIDFPRPNEYKIYATIVWAPPNKNPKHYFDRLKSDVLLFDNGKFQIEPDLHCEFAEVEVEIPKEVFAKKPPEWMIKWAYLFKEDSKLPENECQFRKDFLLSLFINPGVFLVFFLIFYPLVYIVMTSIILALRLLCGIQGIKLKESLEKVSFVRSEVKQFFWHSNYRFLFPLTPIIPLTIFIFLYYLKGSWLISIVLTIFLEVCFILVWFIAEKLYSVKKKKREGAIKLLCANSKEKRLSEKVKIKFHYIKSSICRPYPR